jgi:hypothetical protein
MIANKLNPPKTMLAKVLSVLYRPEYSAGIKYFTLLDRVLVYGSVIVSDFHDAIESGHLVRWDKTRNMIYRV